MRGRSPRSVAFWCAFLLCALFLHLNGLGESYLWQDEAETAVIARNTLREGIPKVFDGLNVVTQIAGDHDARFVSRNVGWLSHYAAAASFWLLGESTFAARLPFALLGVGSLLLLYLLARRWSASPAVPPLALWLGLLSVPHVLYSRQCRYYALAEFFALYLFWAYEELLEGRKRAGPHLAAALLGLFHSSSLLFALSTIPVLAHFAVRARNRRKLLAPHRAWLAAAAALLVPGFVYFSPIGRAAAETAALWHERLANAKALLNDLDAHFFPAAAFPLLWLLRPRLGRLDRPLFCFFGAIFLLLLLPRYFTRYLVTLLPLSAFLFAELAARLYERRRWWAGAFLCLLVSTRLLSASSWTRQAPWLRPDLGLCLREITHPFPEPLKEAVRELNARAAPGELLLVTYPDIPFMFYTRLRVIGGLSGQHRLRRDEVRWVLLRDESERAFWPVDFDLYERIPLPGPDWPWGNRPDPGLHYFAAVDTPSEPALYRLR